MEEMNYGEYRGRLGEKQEMVRGALLRFTKFSLPMCCCVIAHHLIVKKEKAQQIALLRLPSPLMAR